MDKQNILEIKNLSKNYGNYQVLTNISFSIEKGVIVGLLGKNGAGKTTLMKTILGLLCNYDGEILFDGNKINHSDSNQMRRISSLVDVRFYEDMTAYENLNYLLMVDPDLKRQDREIKINERLDMVGLLNNKKDKVKSFSFGMKQRLALAQVFLHKSDLLILDEPFVGLDPVGIETMKDLLRKIQEKEKISIIFSSHQLDEVGDLADKIVAISEGKVKYDGTLADLQNKNKKYSIWFEGKEAPVNIKYNTAELQKVLHEHYDKGMEVIKIEIIEDALYQLFV